MKQRNPLLRILQDSRKQWLGITVIVLSALLAGILQTAVARIWGSIVDLGIAGQTSPMLSQALVMVIILAADCFRTALHYMLIAHTTEKMFLSIRMRAFKVLTDGQVPILDQKLRSGDVAARLNSDTASLCELFAGQFTWLMRVGLQGIVAVITCFFLSWQLSVAYFILLPVSIWLIKRISSPIQKQQKQASDSTGKAMNFATDMLNGLLVIKSFHLEEEMNKRFGGAVDQATEESIKSEKVATKMTMIKYLVSVVQLMTLFVVGTLLIGRGLVTVGQVLAFVALSASVRSAFDLSDNIIRAVRQGTALGQRLYEVLDLPLEENGTECVPDYSADYVMMDKLDFGYEGKPELFRNLSLRVQQGQKVGLVGPSGCGKSSIIKLICKFYSSQSGGFSLFGETAACWSPVALRKELALVTQEPLLFDGTIYENILYGRSDASEEDVEKALKDANLWDFVESLPEKNHTQVGEYGGKLSGGQKQRLSIARAMIKNAPLVLLDEATSALDTQSEKEVQDALDRLLVGKAAVIVAHRLSTLKNVDYIYCIDNGKVIEEGSPEMLMEAEGYFYRMKKQQDTSIELGGKVYANEK